MDVTSYLLGKSQGGGGEINLQNKEITITQNGTQTITKDSGYDGLNSVEVTTNVESPKQPSKLEPIIYESQGLRYISVLGGNANKVKNYNKVLMLSWVRSDYTLTESEELIAETDWFSDGSTNQKIVVSWCNNFIPNSTQIGIEQSTSGRLGVTFILLDSCKKPTNVNILLNESYDGGSGNISYKEITPSNNICIYFNSQIYTTPSNINVDKKLDGLYKYDRTIIAISKDNKPKTIPYNKSGGGIIGIELEYEEPQS